MGRRKLGEIMIKRTMLGLLLLSSATVAMARADAPVTEAELRNDIAVLASDEYGGREGATPGETLTLSYIGTALHRSGFAGGMADGGWYQPVPMTRILQQRAATMTARRRDGTALTIGDFAARSGTQAVQGEYPLVYIGEGRAGDTSAPAGVSGKVVLMSSSPAAMASAPARRAALEEAGAVAVLVAAPENVPFAAAARSVTGRRVVRTADVPSGRPFGLVPATFAQAVGATAAAENLDTARDLGVTVRLDVPAVATYPAPTYNLVAKLPGRRPERGAILLTGHWDHIGAACRPEGAPDRICNGAVDNASGIAVLLAAARRLGVGQRLDHDVYVVATGAEEPGLVGAREFVANLPLPKTSIRAVLNVDTVAIAPRGAPMAIVGRGSNPWLDTVLDDTARALGRAVDPDLEANAFIMRQDGAAFVAEGIPAVMAGGSFANMAPLQAYLSGPYHGPDDELTDATPLGGAADDADLHVAAVRALDRMR